MSNLRQDNSPSAMPPQPGECRDAVHWFVDSVGTYSGSVRGLFLSDYSNDQEALLESAVLNFKSRGVSTLVISGEMLYKQAEYLFQHAVNQSPFGRPLLSKMELDMLDAEVVIVKDLKAPETPPQLWYFYHHLLYPRALNQKSLLLTTALGYDEFIGYGMNCEDLEYAGRKITWEKTAWLLDAMMIDLHHFRQVRSENLPPLLKVEYYLYKAVAARGMNLLPQFIFGDYSLDFAAIEKGNKLAIECDVIASLDQPNSRSADAKRTLSLLSDGWKLLRFTTADLLANLGQCVDAVEEAWTQGRKKSQAGRLISGNVSSRVIDLPVEDDLQRLVIANGGGPVAITGGAGCGKSTCITHRVAHLLAQGVNPERILVVSHSTESVKALKTEVENIADRQQAQKVAFFSWNELGLKILKENTGSIKRKPPLKVEANPQRIIQRLLTKYKKELDQLTLELSEELEEFTIASLISLYKANMVTPKHVKERAKGSVDELVAKVYHGYEEQLQKSNKIDRDDMVSLVALLLADSPDIRARYQYQYEFVLVDEYQDVTAAADMVARLLALPQDNLFIAGDEDESIFESKGSLPKILSEISIRLPNARCYILEKNWRSHPIIVTAAKTLLHGMSRRRIRKDMHPAWEVLDKQAIIGPFQADTESHEAEWVAGEIQALLDSGKNPRDIAILYRYNRYASMVEEALFRRGIKCLTTNPDSTMVPDEVADVMAFLRLVMDPDGPKARESFERVCQLRSKEVDPKLFGTIASFAEANNLSFLKAVEIYSEAIADQSCQDLEQLVRIFRTMNHENLPPAETIALLKRTQRLNEYYKSVKVPPGVNYEPMRKLSALEEEARKFKTVADFVKNKTGLANKTSPDGRESDSEPLVNILSLHEAKGKEFAVVFLTGMAEGLFPSETANDPEEERRLCYLGLTRAKDLLFLSYPKQFNNIALEPSRYLVETGLALAPGQVAGAVHAPGPAALPPQLTPQQVAEQRAAQEAALKAQQEAELKAQQLAAAKAQQEAILRAQKEAETRAKLEAAELAKYDQAMRAQQEAAMRAQQEQAMRAQQEAAMRAQQEAAMRAQQEAAMRAQQEQAMRAQQEAAMRAQQEAAMRAQQEAAMRAQQEAAMRAQQEQAMLAQQESIRIQQEAAMRAQQEAAMHAQKEQAMRAQQEAAMHAQQESIRIQQEEALRVQQEQAILSQQESIRIQQEEALRAQQETTRIQQEEALRAQQQEAAMLAQQESTRIQQESIRQQQEEAARQEQEAMKAQQDAAARAQHEAFLQTQKEQEERAQQEAAMLAQQKSLRIQQEAAAKAHQEAADRAKQAALAKSQEDKPPVVDPLFTGVDTGLPPSSAAVIADVTTQGPPPMSSTEAKKEFWNSVNSAMKTDAQVRGGGGVVPGVPAPRPLPANAANTYNETRQAGPMAAGRAGMQCPGCTEWLEPGSKFCGECGYRLGNKIFACHLCGAPQEPEAKFCGECGSKIAPAEQASHAHVPQVAHVPEANNQGHHKPTQQGWVARMKKLAD